MVGAVVKPKQEHNDPFDLGPVRSAKNSLFLRAKLSYIYRTKIVSAQTQFPKSFQCNIVSIKTDATLTLICSLLKEKTFWTIP